MAKDRCAVTCNGRTAFYACMYEDIRRCAMDCGWAVSLHGSLASDMDIMAMPWVGNAVSFKEMIDRVSKLFKDNDMSSQYVITYNEKPHNRVVATIPIWADFYLDISTINAADVVPKSEYDNLKMQFEALDRECDRLEKAESEKHDKFIEAKAEVVREIFEEIEKVIGEKYELYVFNDREIEGVKQDAIIEFADCMQKHFDELKKKYTEVAE